MRYVAFGFAAIAMAVTTQWFGIAALIFVIGHLWYDALVYGLLTLGASALSALYGALLVVEWFKDHPESLGTDETTV